MSVNNMFNTKLMIREIKKRDCLWNKICPEFSNPQIKRKKWEEIGKIMYEDWDTLKFYVKDDKVQEMTKKWRNVRDYYTKEKRRQEIEDSLPHKRFRKKKRLYSYFNMLSFLDSYQSSSCRPIEAESNQDNVNYSDHGTDSSNVDEFVQDVPQEENMEIKEETPSIRTLQNESIAYSQNHLMASLAQSHDDSHSTAVRNFLLSLIPDVENLNDQEYMGFRLGVLNLLNNIKFNTDSHESWVISTLDNTS